MVRLSSSFESNPFNNIFFQSSLSLETRNGLRSGAKALKLAIDHYSKVHVNVLPYRHVTLSLCRIPMNIMEHLGLTMRWVCKSLLPLRPLFSSERYASDLEESSSDDEIISKPKNCPTSLKSIQSLLKWPQSEFEQLRVSKYTSLKLTNCD